MALPLVIAFEIHDCCCQFKEGYFILPVNLFLFLVLVDNIIHLPVYLVASTIFNFGAIRNSNLVHCLTPFEGVILVVKPYIVLYAFIFDTSYWIKILTSILCTLDNTK